MWWRWSTAGARMTSRTAFERCSHYVREHGTPVGDDELESSDVILPPADLSFEEAGREFTGEGLIPD